MPSHTRSSIAGSLAGACLFLLASGLSGHAQERLPPIPADKMTDAQKKAAAVFQETRGNAPTSGPFGVLLRSPDLMDRTRVLSEYIRLKGVLPANLRQLIILMAARQWTAQYEWAVQYPQSIAAGLSEDTVKAIGDGRRPDRMAEDEAIVYDLCGELFHNQGVSDLTYNRALTRLGEQGVVEAVTTAGYFSLLGMVLTTARTPPPPTTKIAPLLPLSR